MHCVLDVSPKPKEYTRMEYTKSVIETEHEIHQKVWELIKGGDMETLLTGWRVLQLVREARSMGFDIVKRDACHINSCTTSSG